MENVLKKIIRKKRKRIKIYKKEHNENKLYEDIKNINNFTDFKDEIKRRNLEQKISIITEIKKASPSAGIIVEAYNPIEIAKIYQQNKATCLSILTEEDFFLGNLIHISKVKQKINLPILCKDFFIDTYQVPLAKSFGADCILIILSAVDSVLAKDLYQAANDLNIATLVEIHNEKEAELAMKFENSLIGINNRNLKTLEISLETSVKLSKILHPHKLPLICESGISTPEKIKFIINEAKIYNFLIGESLLKSQDIGLKLREMLK